MSPSANFRPKRTSGLDELLYDALGEPRLVPGLDADDVAGALREALDRRPRQPSPVPLRGRAARAQRPDLPLRLLVEHRQLAKFESFNMKRNESSFSISKKIKNVCLNVVAHTYPNWQQEPIDIVIIVLER